jgi:hypothetical protein
MKPAALTLTAAAFLLAAVGSLSLQPTPARADQAVRVSAPTSSKPVEIRIGSTRFRVTATLVRGLPGIIPDPEVLPPPGPTDTITFTLTQVGSRRAPIIYAAAADIVALATPVTLNLTPRTPASPTESVFLARLPPGSIPSIETADQTLPISARLRIATSRGSRFVNIRDIPLNVIPFP